jgi:hypothetical protein
MRKTFDSWSRETGLVTWFFSVPARAHEDARANLERSTRAVLELVAPFGRVNHIEVRTAERGDDAFDFAGNDIARIGEAFSSQETTDIDIWFSLDVDIYASVTFGRSRDNARLARINGPRLTAFLRRLRDRLQARLVDLDAGSYTVNADGLA